MLEGREGEVGEREPRLEGGVGDLAEVGGGVEVVLVEVEAEGEELGDQRVSPDVLPLPGQRHIMHQLSLRPLQQHQRHFRRHSSQRVHLRVRLQRWPVLHLLGDEFVEVGVE